MDCQKKPEQKEIKYASCHSDKKLMGRGLCKNCYDKWLKSNNPEYKERQNENAKKWREKNKERVKLVDRERHKKNNQDPEYRKKRRNAALKRNYDIDLDKYAEMLKSQNGRCVICSREPYQNKNLHVDHCHKTGRVRGLLCARCNWYLATIEKDDNVIMKIIGYLYFRNSKNFLNMESIFKEILMD